MRSTFFVLAAVGAVLATDDASNFDQDTAPQGYSSAAGGAITQISDGQIQAPAYTSPVSSATAPAYSAPTAPVYTAPVSSSAASPPVYTSISVATPPVYSSPSSPVAPPAYTPPPVASSPVVNGTTPAPYPTGGANTTLATSAPAYTPTTASPPQQTGAATTVQISLGVVFAGLLTLFL